MKCLHHAYGKACYFQLTLVGLFHECFESVVMSFEYRFYSPLLILLLEPVLRFPALLSRFFAETSYLNLIAIQLTGCHMMQDLGVGNLGTDN